MLNIRLRGFGSGSEEVVWPIGASIVSSTDHETGRYPASNVLILGEVDATEVAHGKGNFWLAEGGKTTGQGFTLKLDDCSKMIAGCRIKNKGKGALSGIAATKNFTVSGSTNENGPWETLLEDQLVDTRNKAASLLNFTFEEPVEIHKPS